MFSEKLEDWVIWQKAIYLLRQFYKITKDDEYVFLNNQINDAYISINNNIVDGFESENYNECIYFLSVAKTTSEELISKKVLATELLKCNKDEAAILLQLTAELIELITDTIELISEQVLSIEY
ncbi:MAG: hypothetical protein RLZZ175_3172 [Bacteroidota bacterium]